MNQPRHVIQRVLLLTLLLLGATTGCASRKPAGYQMVTPTPVEVAQNEIPEDQLLDVGIEIATARELSEKQMEKLGTNEDIRDSERHFIPFHLKNTLQSSSYWGEVQVVPPDDDTLDVIVTSELVKSNGEILQLRVQALDASGRRWFERKYHAEATQSNFIGTLQGEHDTFQDLYNTVANDLSDFWRSLTPEDVEQIRTVSKLRFARDFAPDAFGDYLADDVNGQYTVQRLPADDDPLLGRIDLIRARQDMFVDTLNQYYEGLYVNMWEAYENWRRYNHAEQVALREVQRDAFVKTLTGILLIAAAIALEAGNVSEAAGTSGILILAGGQVMIGGMNVSEQANIHAEAIRELGDSFGTEMRPTVLELEGKQYELTGTAMEQYEQWKDILRRIYYEETGFVPDLEAFESPEPPSAEDP